MLMNNYFDSYTCRACLEYTDEMVPIFETNEVMSKPMKLSTLLSECTNIELVDHDDFPKQICSKCLNEATRAYKFREKFLKADKFLKEMLAVTTKEARKHVKVDFITVEEDDEADTVVDEDLTIKGETSEIEQCEDDITTEYAVVEQDEEKDLEYTVIIPEENHEKNDDKIGIDDEEELPIRVLVKNKKKSNTFIDITMVVDDGTACTGKVKKKIPGIKKSYICEVCNKCLNTKNGLQEHMKLHMNQFNCRKCGQKFKTNSALEDHEVRHNPYNPNKCKECGRMFRNEEMLEEHTQRAHKEEKPFLCGICGKGFLQKTAFEKHMRIHTGEKPYECGVCQNRFRYKNSLVLHLRCHTDEKPFPCLECNQRFRDKAHLRKHLLVHTGEKPFKCEFCEKGFNRSSNLNAHRKIHTGERKYVCPLCNKAFIQNNVMQAHLANHHKS